LHCAAVFASAEGIPSPTNERWVERDPRETWTIVRPTPSHILVSRSASGLLFCDGSLPWRDEPLAAGLAARGAARKGVLCFLHREAAIAHNGLVSWWRSVRPRKGSMFSLRHTWALSLVFWTVYAILSCAGSFAIRALVGQSAVPFQVFVWNFAEAYVWVLFTPLIYAVAIRYGFTRRTWRKSLAVHVPVSVGMTTLAALLLIQMNGLFGWADTSTPLGVRLIDLGFQELPRCLVTMGVAHAIAYYGRLREREIESSRLAGLLARAQLEILRGQLDPHFLFNALNSIATLSRKDPASAERMTLQLASLLRVSLECVDAQEVPLEKELAFLQNYLEIQQTRFRDRLTIELHIDTNLLAVPVPSLLLQPLVENAIRHGIARSAARGLIGITAARDGGFVKIEVTDNGLGMPQGLGEEGFGLRNTRARLEQLYGDQHDFRLESLAGKGCRVTLAIPLPASRNANGASHAH
jgi:two-component system LytT family sensor kinase